MGLIDRLLKLRTNWYTPPSVTLDSLSPDAQALLAEGAALYREKLGLAPDEPLRVMLPEHPSPALRAILNRE